MISLATAMSKPVERVWFFSSGPWPTVMPAQETVVGIHDPPPGDCFRVDIQAHEAAAFLRRHLVWVFRADAQFLPASLHPAPKMTPRSAFSGVFLLRKKTPEEGVVRLARFMEHTGVDGRRQQVIGGRYGVNVAGEVQVEIFHRDHLTVTPTGRPPL